MLDVGVSGLDGGFKTNTKYLNSKCILNLKKLVATLIDLFWRKTLASFAMLIDEQNQIRL